MPNIDNYIMMGIGGFFLLLGIIAFLRARGEARGLNYSRSPRPALREFITRGPMRVEPGALRVGGWIFITVGLVLIILGGAFLAID